MTPNIFNEAKKSDSSISVFIGINSYLVSVIHMNVSFFFIIIPKFSQTNTFVTFSFEISQTDSINSSYLKNIVYM